MIPWFQPTLWGKEQEYVAEAIESSWISDGQFIVRFEQELAAQLGTAHAISVNNGTSALELALLALDIRPGDEVIVPAFTFAAPINMVLSVGATPLVVDVLPDTWCIDPEAIREKITSRTKAIIVVHLYGNVCDMDAILSLAKERGISVIEDVAEAAFSTYRGKAAGTWGDIGCFSFQATKTLTMGEGGAVVMQCDRLNDKARLYRNHGMRPEKRYWHEVVGHNFRLTNYQAAFGLAQLHALPTIIERKNFVYHTYRDLLANIPDVQLQHFPSTVEPVVWAIVVQLKNRTAAECETVAKQLLERGIETRRGFTYFGEMPIYQNFIPSLLPNAARLSDTVLSLPSFATLTLSQLTEICDQFKGVLTGEV